MVVECVSSAILVGLVWVIKPHALLSVVWGTLVFLIPSAYFTYYAFRQSATQWAGLVVLSMFRGLMGKMLLTSAGFALAFNFARPVHAEYLFGSYLVLWFAHLIGAAKFDCDSDLLRSRSLNQ
jgi:ATP synthase protein I